MNAWLNWVFSVVITGITINIAHYYLQPWVDKQVGKMFDFQRIRNESTRAEIEMLAQQMIDDRDYLILNSQWLIRDYIMSWIWLILAGTFLLLSRDVQDSYTRPAIPTK